MKKLIQLLIIYFNEKRNLSNKIIYKLLEIN